MNLKISEAVKIICEYMGDNPYTASEKNGSELMGNYHKSIDHLMPVLNKMSKYQYSYYGIISHLAELLKKYGEPYKTPQEAACNAIAMEILKYKEKNNEK